MGPHKQMDFETWFKDNEATWLELFEDNPLLSDGSDDGWLDELRAKAGEDPAKQLWVDTLYHQAGGRETFDLIHQVSGERLGQLGIKQQRQLARDMTAHAQAEVDHLETLLANAEDRLLDSHTKLRRLIGEKQAIDRAIVKLEREIEERWTNKRLKQ